MEKSSAVSRRFARSLAACVIFATAVVFIAPDASFAAPSNKITICHRTRSVTNPYRRITVNRNAVNNSGHGNASHSGSVFNTTAGYYNTNPKVWGDIIPGAGYFNGSNSFDKNWTGDQNSGGQSFLRLDGVNRDKCGLMTAKQFYDVQLAAGVPSADIITELNDMAANEDLDLKASLGGSFSAATISTWESTVAVTTNDATSVVDGSGSNGTATLQGSVKYVSGKSVRYFFELDTDAAFPSPERTSETNTIAAPFPSITATGSDLAVAGVPVTALTTGTWYFRLVAVTNFETDTESILYGNVKTFGIGVPVVTTVSLPDGQVGTAYNQTVTSAGGTAPRSNYLVASGSLPTSLSLSTAGAITGTPSAVGLYAFTVTVQDATPTTSAARALTIRVKSPQTVTIPDPGTKTYGDATFSVNPATTVTADEISDLGTYTYSGTSGVCDIDASGTVTITGAGTCTITVNHTGNGYFLSGSNTRTFTVNPKPITIKADDKTKEVDGANPSFTYAITVGALAGSDAIGSLTYTHSSASYTASTNVPNVVGSFTITPSAAVFSTGAAANYAITYLTGMLTVSAAPTTTSSSTSTTAAPATTAATTTSSSTSTTAAPGTTAAAATTTKAPTTTAAPTTTVAKVDPRKTTSDPFVNISAEPKPNGKSTGGSLTIDGDPSMEVLSVASSDPNVSVDVTKSGVEYNKPETWVAEGFGDECWKIEPGGSAYILPAVPTPPSGKSGYYSTVKVKAGSITSTDPDFQVNTIFPSPSGGDRVWPDSNRNGIYDAGGKNGDKDISHVILCIRYGSPGAATTTTIPATATGSTTSTTSTTAAAPTTTAAPGSTTSTSSSPTSSSTLVPGSSTTTTTSVGTSTTVAATTTTQGGSTPTTLPINAKDDDGPKDNIVVKLEASRAVVESGRPVTIVMRLSTGTEESIVKLSVIPESMAVAEVRAQSVAAVDVVATAETSRVAVLKNSAVKVALPATGSNSSSMVSWVFLLIGLGAVVRVFGRWVSRR